MLSVAVACSIVLAAGDRSLGLPGLPGLPSVPDVKQAAKGAISNELLKQFGAWFNINRPVYVSGNDVMPTVAVLPGGRFHPASQAAVQKLFSHSRTPLVRMPPGDYNVTVVTYCMGHNNQGPWRNKFLLAPIKGAWSDVVTALNYRAYGSRFSPPQIQVLSWALQAGMGYGEMSDGSRQIVDALLPEYKQRLQGDFYQRARDEWNSIASKVPGAPSFENALGRLGEVGKDLTQLQQARDQIVGNANDFNALVARFAHLGMDRTANLVATTPWSIVRPGVYARLRTRGTLLTPGVVQLRVTASAAASFDVTSTRLRGLGRQVAFTFDFPFTNFAGYFNGGTQPLSWTPQPNTPPDPNQSGGGPDTTPGGWQYYGSAWHPGGGPSGQNNGGSNNGGPNDSGSGDNGGGGGSGTSDNNPTAHQGGTEDNTDASSSCDPPGNVFGVQKGTVVSSGATSLTLGRGTGTGLVCLLMRPFLDMSALGWPDRFNATIDYGTVAYNLPGQTQFGHVVVSARYAYLQNNSSNLGIYHLENQKPEVTAVIDFSGVTSFCPELTQSMTPKMGFPDWLSGASLENRLCMTAMTGADIQVRAWIVDAPVVAPSALTHAVDPQNFLYSDYWGHM